VYLFGMALKTFDVPWLEGRVRSVNHDGSKARITVECFHRKLAFLIVHDGNVGLSSGRWVRFRGIVRTDPSVRSDGSLAEKNLSYLHDPADGSRASEWMFFELRSPEFRLLGPKETVDSLREAMVLMRRHVDSWVHNCQPEAIDQTIESVETALRVMRAIRSDMSSAEREPAIRYPDITV